MGIHCTKKRMSLEGADVAVGSSGESCRNNKYFKGIPLGAENLQNVVS